MPTLAQRLREEGFQEGFQEGRTEVLKEVTRNMLDNGHSIQKIMKVTTLTEAEIQRLRN